MKMKALTVLGIAGSLSACATLPSSGPTGSQVVKSVTKSEVPSDISIVEIEDATTLPATVQDAAVPLPDLPPPPTDRVGPGDVLQIAIYEAGVSLFGGGGGNGSTSGPSTFDSSAKAHTLQGIRVTDDGDIIIPYAGKLHVAGKTIGQVQSQIQRALLGFTQQPQVLITTSNVITNSVIVSGEITKPGRLPLQTNRETLSDVVALAGGYRGRASEIAVRVTRGDQTVELRMTDLIERTGSDMRAYPGDRVALISAPRSFSMLGAPGRVDLIPFSRSTISLTEAIATAGGINPNVGDPAAVFVFRYVVDAEGKPKPVVYHLNMMRTQSYFLSQRFTMRDHDILYVGNARANQPSKVIQLVSQLFSPILTVTSAVQTVKLSR